MASTASDQKMDGLSAQIDNLSDLMKQNMIFTRDIQKSMTALEENMLKKMHERDKEVSSALYEIQQNALKSEAKFAEMFERLEQVERKTAQPAAAAAPPPSPFGASRAWGLLLHRLRMVLARLLGGRHPRQLRGTRTLEALVIHPRSKLRRNGRPARTDAPRVSLLRARPRVLHRAVALRKAPPTSMPISFGLQGSPGSSCIPHLRPSSRAIGSTL